MAAGGDGEGGGGRRSQDEQPLFEASPTEPRVVGTAASSTSCASANTKEAELRLLGAGLLSLSQIPALCGKSPASTLQRLQLHGNRLATVAGLRYAAPLLEWLVLSSNELKNLEGISGLDKLQVLDVSSNQLDSLQGLEGLENLEELAAAHNSIKHLDGLSAMRGRNSRLRSLDLVGNLLGAGSDCISEEKQGSSAGELLLLGGLDRLQSLRLQNKDGQRANPICRLANYRSITLRAAASLLVLDEEPVSSVSRYAAHSIADTDLLLPPTWPRAQLQAVVQTGRKETPFSDAGLRVSFARKDTLCELRAELQELRQLQRYDESDVGSTTAAATAAAAADPTINCTSPAIGQEEANKVIDHALTDAQSHLEDLRQDRHCLEAAAVAGRVRLELEKSEEGKLWSQLQIVTSEAKRRAQVHGEVFSDLRRSEHQLHARQHQAFRLQHRLEQMRAETAALMAASAVCREEADAASASSYWLQEQAQEAEAAYQERTTEAEALVQEVWSLDEELHLERLQMVEGERHTDEIRLEVAGVESRLATLHQLHTKREESSVWHTSRVEAARRELLGLREEGEELKEVIARQNLGLRHLIQEVESAKSEILTMDSVLLTMHQEEQSEAQALKHFEASEIEAMSEVQTSRARQAQELEAEEEAAKSSFQASKAAWSGRAEDLERWAHALRSEAEREERSMQTALDRASEERDEVQRLQGEVANSRTMELEASECAFTAQARLVRETKILGEVAERFHCTQKDLTEEHLSEAGEYIAKTLLQEALQEADSARSTLTRDLGRRAAARDEEGRLKRNLEELEELYSSNHWFCREAETELSSLRRKWADEERSMDLMMSELQTQKDRHSLQTEDVSKRADSWRKAEAEVAKRLLEEQDLEKNHLDEERACGRELHRLEDLSEARAADLAEAAASADAFEKRRRELRFESQATIQELRSAGLDATDDARNKLQALDQQLSKEVSRHQRSLRQSEQHLEQLRTKVQVYQTEEESALLEFQEERDKRAQEAVALAAAFRAA